VLLLLLLLLLLLSLSDAVVDRLGTVLRLLYIRDLRQLQTTIDRMLVEVQVSRKFDRIHKWHGTSCGGKAAAQ
jgi:hypothetical protein